MHGFTPWSLPFKGDSIGPSTFCGASPEVGLLWYTPRWRPFIVLCGKVVCQET